MSRVTLTRVLNPRQRGSAALCLSAVVALCCSACLQDEPLAQGVVDGNGVGKGVCLDEDGDGRGVGCSAGLDCDDADSSVTIECLCDEPNVGCPCDAPGSNAACGTAYARVGQQLVCGTGFMTCGTEGSWGECIINEAVTLQRSRQVLVLGSSSECSSNPCDPECVTFEDTPDDLVLDDSLAAGPQGVTLAGGDDVVVTTPIGGGFNCAGGDYPSDGACGHHLCEIGDVLDTACDEVPASTVTLTLFSDDFTNDNTQGWSLDTSWAIGSAQSSSGHTQGNADPSQDATSTTSDNKLAGTTLGGNIGGGTVLWQDTFSNLNNWTETGDGDWNTESLHRTTTYPASGSGSPAAHSDNCDGGCTITQTSGINLSGYASASLELLRFLDSELDSGEYLRGDVWNGSSWIQVFNWNGGGADDDNDWHAHTLDITPYLNSSFKVRFRTLTSSDDEHVHVDDLRITVPPVSQTNWLTSPAFDATAATGAITLSFQRWLNIEAPASRTASVQVFDGSSWVNLWTNSAAVTDSSWQSLQYDLTGYANNAMRVRFGWSGAATSRVSGWNLDDVLVQGIVDVPASAGCVGNICALDATCCSDSWHAGCLGLIEATCQIDCSVNTASGECVSCYNDPSEATDHDGDGFSPLTGDCKECDATISPRAFDFDNGMDDDCDGSVDNGATGCDGALSQGGSAMDHARAMGLCKVATASSWGVVSAAFVKANGTTACTDTNQYRILSDYGSGNLPTEGQQMAVYSSGTARDRTDSGWVQPNGNSAYKNSSSSASTPPYTIPAALGCSAGTPGYDSCGLKLTIRAPSNVQSFSFNFNFFTSEYPEWLCTAYNDAFVAYYYGALNTRSNKNISFDALGNPVSVNNGFFTVPGWPPPSGGTHAKLNGSGFDGVCANAYGGASYTANSICGGATDWLVTTSPVNPSEQIDLHFSIWDTGDQVWDSTVLVDNFQWSAATASIETGVYEPGETELPTLYEDAWFVRDYDMTGVCAEHQRPVWGLWSWSASTPSDSSIEFSVRTAASAAELSSAPADALLFSDPPGPSGLVGTAVVANTSNSTTAGSAVVDTTLAASGRLRNNDHVRVLVHLVPSTDQLSAPVLQSWNLQTSCVDSQ